jgi:hypothetical protein
MPRVIAVVSATIAVCLGSAVAFGAIPSAGGTISACVKKSTRTLRVIDAARQTCRRSERLLTWSQSGPQGPAGAPGRDGAAGPKGDPGTSTATFAFTTQPFVMNFQNGGSVAYEILAKFLSPGSWAVDATVNSTAGPTVGADTIRDMHCELHNPAGAVIGSAADRRFIKGQDTVRRSLSMNGGAVVGRFGGEVSVWCQSQMPGETVDQAQMMLIQVDHFS